MPDKDWKQTERRQAQRTGGKRIPVNGRPGPDIWHPILAIESKLRSKVPHYLAEWLEQAEHGAPPSKVAVVVLHLKGDRYANDIALIRFDRLIELVAQVVEECGG